MKHPLDYADPFDEPVTDDEILSAYLTEVARSELVYASVGEVANTLGVFPTRVDGLRLLNAAVWYNEGAMEIAGEEKVKRCVWKRKREHSGT